MIKLYTVLRTGEVLKAEVFRGLYECNYDLIPVVSEGSTKYINMARRPSGASKNNQNPLISANYLTSTSEACRQELKGSNATAPTVR